MYQDNCEFKVLVDGSPIYEYPHEGKIHVEGRKNKNYEIYFRNNSGVRKKIVVSVDGLNILTGDSTWERGYVIEPYGHITIPGWRKDSGSVAAFRFSNLKDSYNQHNTSGNASNVGVIGCRVFDEKWKPAPKPIPQQVVDYVPWPLPKQFPNQWVYHHPRKTYNRGVNYNSNDLGRCTYNSTMEDAPAAASIMNMQQLAWAAPNFGSDNVVATAASSPPLGTAWGEDTSFHTVDVYYEFYPYSTTTFAIYYDSREGLIRKGVNLGRYTHTRKSPNPFPRDGCPDPIY